MRVCTILLVTLSVFNLAHGQEKKPEPETWRSQLYPKGWTPAWRDAEGRFLHDFSYAGYHRGEKEIPSVKGPVFNVTDASFAADSSGKQDATAAIQKALDAAAAAGGGVVYLPAGTYLLAPPLGSRVALQMKGNGVVLRGAGVDQTFLINTDTSMRNKTTILVKPAKPLWWFAEGKWVKSSAVREDLPNQTLTIPVEDVSLFQPGDAILVRNDPTERFIAYLGMKGKWTPDNLRHRGLIFFRRVVAIDHKAQTLTIDVPLRYELLKADNARVVKTSGNMITECGLEDFSIGMRQSSKAGLGRKDYEKKGTAAFEAHQSHAIALTSAENCWVRRVNTFAPPGNDPQVHLLSNGIKAAQSRLVTIKDCRWFFPQYQGGGGNGYLYTLQGSDCLIQGCHAEGGRHNYDFATMSCTGNVIVDSMAKDGYLASDFHMYFSVANLVDNVVCDGDFFEAKYRPYGWPPHGPTTSQSVFWNLQGLNYIASPFEFDGKMIKRKQVLVESRQFKIGYVIGTRGPASRVSADKDEWVEGVGKGDLLEPPSLYWDQKQRRLGYLSSSK